jgi:hypothetical protein
MLVFTGTTYRRYDIAIGVDPPALLTTEMASNYFQQEPRWSSETTL